MTQTTLTIEMLARNEKPDYVEILVTADNYEDRGDLRTAEALRWLCDNKKWPLKGDAGNDHVWCHFSDYCDEDELDHYDTVSTSDELPDAFFSKRDKRKWSWGRVCWAKSLLNALRWFLKRYWSHYKPSL